MPRFPRNEERREQGGPSLYRVIGRPAGNMAGYAYFNAMKASVAKGLIWTADNVAKYLATPHLFLSIISALRILATK
jgi:cytochrome c2